jgi:hypothetical protein
VHAVEEIERQRQQDQEPDEQGQLPEMAGALPRRTQPANFTQRGAHGLSIAHRGPPMTR